jgi:steroid delta-isomerase-like uncharacterized protein
MSTEENKTIARRSFEEPWNQGNLAAVDEIYAATYVNHDPANPGIEGLAGQKQLIRTYRTAFPDTHFKIEEQIAEGDKVVTRWTATGTHRGDLMGIAPTGKQARVSGINIDHIADGKIQESWSNWDTLGLMQQLGVVPAPGQA